MRKLPEITDRQRQAIVSTFNFEHKDPQLLRLCCAPKVCGPLSLERLRAIAGRFVPETEALVGAGLEGCEQLPWPRQKGVFMWSLQDFSLFLQEAILSYPFPSCEHFSPTVKTIFHYFELGAM